jgi:hypothetical protein
MRDAAVSQQHVCFPPSWISRRIRVSISGGLAHRHGQSLIEAVFDYSLRSLRIALGVRLLRRHSGTIKRVRSLLLSTAARDPLERRIARADERRSDERTPL